MGGSPAHQKHILANLATSLFEHGKITTTEARARRLRPYAEKLIDMGLALKDSPPGFDPSSAVDSFTGDEDESYVETEQY